MSSKDPNSKPIFSHGFKHQINASSQDHLDSGLYIVATPIGNLEDITLRALKVLSNADVIACENTRTTAKLLDRYGIQTSTISYHEHNASRAITGVISRLKKKQVIALVSEAGTPLISDPGYKIVSAAIDQGYPVITVPGPSAPIAALMVAGLPTDRFFFAGFLPSRTTSRQKALAKLEFIPATLVFLESPKRLVATLIDMAEIFGGREVSIMREMTKKFEEHRRGKVKNLAEQYQKEPIVKGEITIIVGPPSNTISVDNSQIDRLIGKALAEGGRIRDIVDQVASITGAPRRNVYERANKLKSR